MAMHGQARRYYSPSYFSTQGTQMQQDTVRSLKFTPKTGSAPVVSAEAFVCAGNNKQTRLLTGVLTADTTQDTSTAL